MTMQRAVRDAVAQGQVDAAPRRGIRLPGSELPPPPAPVATVERWRQVENDILREFLNGDSVEPGDTLPPTKILCARFGVSRRTLHKALCSLCARGILRHRDRENRVPLMGGRRVVGRIALITRGDRTGLPARTTPWTQSNIRALEAACGAAAVALEVVLCDYLSGALSPMAGMRRHPSGLDPDGLLGVIVWPLSLESQFVAHVMQRLTSLACPVAVLAEEPMAGALAPQGRRFRAFSLPSDRDAGLAMGDHLRSLGHRHVAFLSHVPGDAWAQQRLDGLRHALGPRSTVIEYWPAGTARKPDDPREAKVQRATLLLQEAAESLPIGRQRARAAQQAAANAFGVALDSESAATALAAHFRAALREPAHTAWICANDSAAIEAIALLERERIDVPGKISVAGFDNSEEAFLRQLTSFDHNARALARAQVGHLLGWSPVRHLPSVSAIEGTVVMRASTGPARPRG